MNHGSITYCKLIHYEYCGEQYKEFDFRDKESKSFYREAAKSGVERLTIVYPNRNFIQENKNKWRIFFQVNDINITVNARLS